MSYTIVEAYYRQPHFEFFSQYASPFYSITFELDATELRAFAKERGYPTYLSLCYFLTRAMQGLEDFRYRLREGQIVLHDTLHFGMTVPAPGGLFSFCNFDYDPDPATFYPHAQQRLAAVRDSVSLQTTGRPNELHFTAIPEISFTSFTHVPPDDPTEGAVKVALGRFLHSGGRIRVPIALLINHIFIDGAALGRLANAAQEIYANPLLAVAGK